VTTEDGIRGVDHLALTCPGCGVSHDRSLTDGNAEPGDMTACPLCDSALRFPTGPSIWFDRVDDKTIPIRDLVVVDRVRARLKLGRRAVKR
jgi:hypothetical protein